MKEGRQSFHFPKKKEATKVKSFENEFINLKAVGFPAEISEKMEYLGI